MEFHEKLGYVVKNGFKIYPQHDILISFPTDRAVLLAVWIEDRFNLIYKNKVSKGKFMHDKVSINTALTKTVEYIYSKLIEKQKK